jgi:hypothetical protein
MQLRGDAAAFLCPLQPCAPQQLMSVLTTSLEQCGRDRLPAGRMCRLATRHLPAERHASASAGASAAQQVQDPTAYRTQQHAQVQLTSVLP